MDIKAKEAIDNILSQTELDEKKNFFEAELKKLMWAPQDARSLLVIAAGMSLHGMDTDERFQERHMELLAEHGAYHTVSMELDRTYGI